MKTTNQLKQKYKLTVNFILKRVRVLEAEVSWETDADLGILPAFYTPLFTNKWFRFSNETIVADRNLKMLDPEFRFMVFCG